MPVDLVGTAVIGFGVLQVGLTAYVLAALRSYGDTVGKLRAQVDNLPALLAVTEKTEQAAGYGRERGKNLATHEDLSLVADQLRQTTRAVEEVKAAITGELWLKQEVWRFKKDQYMLLLEAFYELLVDTRKAEAKSTAEQLQRYEALLERFMKTRIRAGLLLPDEMNKLLRQLSRDLDAVPLEPFQQWYLKSVEVVESAFVRASVIARKDLRM